MTTSASLQPSDRSAVRPLTALHVVGFSFLALLGYSSVYLFRHTWDAEAYSHGPIIVAIILWLIWRAPLPTLDAMPPLRQTSWGWLLLVAGLAIYVIGRHLRMPMFEVAALIPVACGLLLVLGGTAVLRHYAFPILFLLFLIPLPQFMLDAVTGPLKGKVSYLTEFILYHAGYPISRSGVILSIGQYQLLVADACSGLNSMFSLSAMGLLYLHLMQHTSRLRNALLLLSIIPIAMFANLVRVLSLVLITYHGGDEMGQGFLHGFAGMFLFLIALACLIGFDRLLGAWPRVRDVRREGAAA